MSPSLLPLTARVICLTLTEPASIGALTGLAAAPRDITGARQGELRNYPITSHRRFLLERNPAGHAAVSLLGREAGQAVQPRQAGSGHVGPDTGTGT